MEMQVGWSAFRSLHARLQAGARVILIDNSEVQCRELPIVERDTAIAPLATEYHFRILDNFWLVEYEIGTAPK